MHLIIHRYDHAKLVESYRLDFDAGEGRPPTPTLTLQTPVENIDGPTLIADPLLDALMRTFNPRRRNLHDKPPTPTQGNPQS